MGKYDWQANHMHRKNRECRVRSSAGKKGTKTGNDGTFGTQIPERKKEMEIRGRGLREMDIMKEKEEKQGNKRPFDSFKTAVINIIKRITS